MFAAIVLKELQLLRRDPRALLRLILLPIAFIALFGQVFDSADRRERAARRIAVWRDPSSQLAAQVVAALDRSGSLTVQPADSAAAVRGAVSSKRVDVGLVIAADFDPRRGHPAELVIDEGGSPIAIGPIEGTIRAIMTRVVMGDGSPPEVFVAKTPPGIQPPRHGLSSFQISVPGNAVLFGFFIALTCALSFAEERRTGTGRRLLSAPVARGKLLVAKLAPFVVLGALQVGLMFVIGAAAFRMQVAGSIAALAVLTIGVAFCAASLGLLIASVSTTDKQISSLGSVVVLIMGLLGGCMVPRVLMPSLMQKVGLFVPNGWALDGYYTLLVRDGATIADVVTEIGAVYGFGAVFCLAGMRRFRFAP